MLRVAVPLAAIGALGIATQTAAAQTATETSTSIPISISDRSLSFGQSLVLSGRAAGEKGQVELQFRPRGTAAWKRIGRHTPARDGRFRFTPKLSRTGALRVVTVPKPASRETVGSAGGRTSRERGVVVAGRIGLRQAKLAVNRGEKALVRGTLTPGVAGRSVVLEKASGKKWVRIGRDKTDSKGRFSLAAKTSSTSSAPVRVRFAGDRRNAGAKRTAGRLAVLRPALASRYDAYGGPLACGGSLGYSAMVVAHKSLPCGTKVTIRYRGRTAQAVVRDRGPYVGGREFDLAGAVARKLGFNGVGTIYVATSR
jgi:peptidoglycan lytic transglycosylase